MAAMPSRCPTPSPAASSGRYANPGSATMRAESNFRFRCYRTPEDVVENRVNRAGKAGPTASRPRMRSCFTRSNRTRRSRPFHGGTLGYPD